MKNRSQNQLKEVIQVSYDASGKNIYRSISVKF